MKKFFLLVFLLSSSCLLFSDTEAFKTKFFTPSTDLITPHIKWLNPSNQGKRNILFITYRRDGGFRETIEFYQRMEMDFTVFTLATPDKFAPWSSYYKPVQVTDEEYQKDLEEKLKNKYDVIILGKVRWNVIPQKFRDMILNKVNEGTLLLAYLGDFGGLKLADDMKSEDLKKATENKINLNRKFLFPYKGLPQFSTYPDFEKFINSTTEIYSYGAGNIILLKGYGVPHFQQLTPGNMRNPLETKLVEYDYLIAYIIHLINSFVKVPGVEIYGNDYIKTDVSSFQKLNFVVNSKNEENVVCDFVLRNDDNEVFISKNKIVNLKKGENEIAFDVDRKVPAGRYFADFWVKKGDKIIDFGSSFVEINSDDAIKEISIKPSYKKDEQISGEITVASKQGKDDLAVRINLIDNFGRVISDKTIDLKGEKITEKKLSFSLPPANYLTIIQNLEVSLFSSNTMIDRKKTIFSISDLKPVQDDIRFILWFPYYNASYGEFWYCKNIYDSGFDSRYYNAVGYVPLMANLWYVSNPIRFVDMKTDPWGTMDRKPDDHVREPCLNNPDYLLDVEKKLKQAVTNEMPFSVYEYSCGDECHFASWRPPYDRYELCWCDRCVEKFHKWLEEKYKTIKDLNKAWNTNYNSFEEIKPVTVSQARENVQLVPVWVNYRIFMEDTWTGIFDYAKKIIQSINPEAKVGYEGSQRGYTYTNSFTAEDYYKLMQVMTLNNPYGHTFINYAFKDFAKPGTLLGLAWHGSYGAGERNRNVHPWHSLLRGANSFWIWHGPPREQSVISPDCSFYDFFKPYIKEVQEIKKGTGKLFISSEREDDGIAILYSNTSVHASALTPQFPPIADYLDTLFNYLEQSGFQFRVISYKELEDGILSKGNFKLLILPFCQSISRKQANEIIKFVSNGGSVLADIRPGVCDENCVPYKNEGVLDRIFGIKQQTEKFDAKKIENQETKIVEINYGENKFKLPLTYIDASIVSIAESKSSYENVPLLITNKYGKGKTMLLNFSLLNYTQKDVDKTGFRPLNEVIKFCGIDEKVKYDTDPLSVPFVPFRYKLDSQRFLGLISYWREGDAKKVKISLPQKYHVYNMRKAHYIGFTDSFSVDILPETVEVFSFMPYKVRDIQIKCPETLKKGDVLKYEIELFTEDGKKPETHIFNVCVFSPDGQELKYYMENLKAVSGKAKGQINLALNEKTGNYRLSVKDAATGFYKEIKFTVKE